MNEKLLRLKKYMDNYKILVKFLFSVIVFIISFILIELIFNSDTVVTLIDSVIVSQFITYALYTELHDYLKQLEKKYGNQ